MFFNKDKTKFSVIPFTMALKDTIKTWFTEFLARQFSGKVLLIVAGIAFVIGLIL